jgi:hypothetical protein
MPAGNFFWVSLHSENRLLAIFLCAPSLPTVVQTHVSMNDHYEPCITASIQMCDILNCSEVIQSPAVVTKGKVTSKKSVNYASATCGAKIIVANPEAQNAAFILMENKDMYMINPCKARKVYVMTSLFIVIVFLI